MRNTGIFQFYVEHNNITAVNVYVHGFTTMVCLYYCDIPPPYRMIYTEVWIYTQFVLKCILVYYHLTFLRPVTLISKLILKVLYRCPSWPTPLPRLKSYVPVSSTMNFMQHVWVNKPLLIFKLNCNEYTLTVYVAENEHVGCRFPAKRDSSRNQKRSTRWKPTVCVEHTIVLRKASSNGACQLTNLYVFWFYHELLQLFIQFWCSYRANMLLAP